MSHDQSKHKFFACGGTNYIAENILSGDAAEAIYLENMFEW